MELLNIDTRFPDEREYEAEKRKYIAEYTEYMPGGFFTRGYSVGRPDVAAAQWNRWFPNGFEDWRESGCRVSYGDLKVVADKLNELIRVSSEEIVGAKHFLNFVESQMKSPTTPNK